MPPPLTALIVDDDPSMSAVFTRLLTKMGYVVKSAATGEQALELIKSRLFDLALVDKQLPGVGGISVARALRSNTPDAVIIFITGHATTTSAEELVGIADEYLTKPFDLDTVRETVSALIAQRRGFRQAQPSPVPSADASKKWVHVCCEDAAARAVILTQLERLGARATTGPTLPEEPPNVLVLLAAHATFEVRKTIWAFQAKRRSFQVVLLTDPTSASDAAAAVALRASWRITVPTKPEQAFVVLSGALR